MRRERREREGKSNKELREQEYELCQSTWVKNPQLLVVINERQWPYF